MRQRVSFAAVAAVALGACSGGGDEAAGSLDEWCALAERIAEIEGDDPGLLAVDGAGSDSLTRYRALLGEAAAVAPEAVLADANARADGVDRFVGVAESVEFDFDRLDDDELVDVAGSVLELAEPIARIRGFNQAECGLTAAPTTQTAPATIEPAPTTAMTDAAFAGDPDSDWCARARDFDALSEESDDVFFGDPIEIEVFMTDMIVRMEEASAAAPPAITDEIATWLAGTRALDDALAAAGYDPFVTDLSVIGERDAEMSAALDVIDRYNADVCGIEIDADDDGNDFDPTAGTIRDQAITELIRQGFTEDEAVCIFDNLDFSDPATVNDGGAIAEVLAMCDVDLERMSEIG